MISLRRPRVGGGTAVPVAVAVLAKAPLPGRVKTRLCPPYSMAQAADLATAALADTLDAVAAAAVAHRFLIIDGDGSPWRRPGLRVLAQHGAGLADRIEHALAEVAAITRVPALVVGMDTPQLGSDDLERAAATLAISRSVLGPATDGGFWAIGVHDPAVGLCRGVPMSRSDTGRLQYRRLHDLSLDPVRLEPRTDVDDVWSAAFVAALAPRTRFATLLNALDRAA